MSGAPGAPGAAAERCAARHLRLGWWLLLAFLSLGLLLEGFHGFKVRWYLDVASEPRRLTFTLAHAHGTLLGLVHVAFALTLRASAAPAALRVRLASPCLTLASLLLPGGFLLGGFQVFGGDPGLAVLVVPLGGLLLLAAVALTALEVGRGRAAPPGPPGGAPRP